MKKPSFSERVFAIVGKIPKGDVMTYGQVAKKAGNSKAARAVGAVLRTNFDESIPCHRVVAANGALTGYNRGLEKKRALLQKEGATKSLELLKRKNN